MRADAQVLHGEAREVIKEALVTYEGDPRHVAIYVALRETGWNEVLLGLSRSAMTVSGRRASVIQDAVEQHLKRKLESYLNGNSE